MDLHSNLKFGSQQKGLAYFIKHFTIIYIYHIINIAGKDFTTNIILHFKKILS